MQLLTQIQVTEAIQEESYSHLLYIGLNIIENRTYCKKNMLI